MIWLYKNKEVTEIPAEFIGFVYLITNTTNERKYIGKKLTQFKRTKKPLKGKVNKRRYTVESDWKDYYGSSDELQFTHKVLESKRWYNGHIRVRVHQKGILKE